MSLTTAAGAAAAAAVAVVAAVVDRDGVQWRQWRGRLMAAAALVAMFNDGGIGQ